MVLSAFFAIRLHAVNCLIFAILFHAYKLVGKSTPADAPLKIRMAIFNELRVNNLFLNISPC